MKYICSTCGTQFQETPVPPPACPVCEEVRQFVPPLGQTWTTLEKLRRTHWNNFRRLEPGLLSVGMVPDFAIGQRALLIQSRDGNVLWDCVSLIDESTIELLNGIGGITAVAISHPHYYTAMVEWSEAFGGVPIYLHAADRKWVQRPDAAIKFWSGETHPLGSGLTLIRCGGHFAGGTVLHWQSGAGGRGALLCGDILQVTMDRQFVSFMRSYPNLIPLSRSSVESVVNALRPFAYDRIYGAWWDREIDSNAPQVVARSLERYVNAIERPPIEDPE